MARFVEKQLTQTDKGAQLKSNDPKGRLPGWILTWFYITAVICTWDASFIMFRPYSLPGGSMAWIWYLYKHYITVDQRYLDTKDAFVFAQSLLNYAEVVFNIVTIIMHYQCSRHTIATAFTVSTMTMWKTVLYFLMFSDFCTSSVYRVGNTALQEFFMVVIPNGIWIVVPLAAMWALWSKLVEASRDPWPVSAGPHQGQGQTEQVEKTEEQRNVVRGPGAFVFNCAPVASHVKQRSSIGLFSE